MEQLAEAIRWVHVVAGFTGLAAFWVPIITIKGGPNHRFYGKIFKYSAYVVLWGAIIAVCLRLGEGLASGAGPSTSPSGFAFAVFLGYLAVVTLIGLRHGIGVLQDKTDITRMNSSKNRFIAWLAVAASVGLIAYALYFQPPVIIIMLALSPIGFGTGFGILKAIKGKRPERKVWFYEHMGAMIGTGIAFHTAFAVFGSGRLFNLGLEGWTAAIPWILPALIGIPGSIIWTRHYKNKFKDHGTQATTA